MKFNVVKQFTLNHDDGTTEVFKPGEHDREPHIANHWFVQAHTDKPPKEAVALGTPQYAAAMRALVGKRSAMLDEALEALREAEIALATKVEPAPEPELEPEPETPADVEQQVEDPAPAGDPPKAGRRPLPSTQA